MTVVTMIRTKSVYGSYDHYGQDMEYLANKKELSPIQILDLVSKTFNKRYCYDNRKYGYCAVDSDYKTNTKSGMNRKDWMRDLITQVYDKSITEIHISAWSAVDWCEHEIIIEKHCENA